MTYRHYSFDVWLTLIRSNPAFRRERTAWFACHFNPLGHPLGQVETTIRDVDQTCTRINELVGKHMDTRELVLLIAQRLGTDLNQLSPVSLVTALEELNELFTQYPPVLTDGELPRVLSTLRARGATLSLLSNTGLIQGACLRRFWDRVGMGELFAFQLYSDEVGLSKPNPALYALLYRQARQLSERAEPLLPSHILHIGDNPVADEAGAKAAQLCTLLIQPDKPGFSDLLL